MNEFLIFSSFPLLQMVNATRETRGTIQSGVRGTNQERACTAQDHQETPCYKTDIQRVKKTAMSGGQKTYGSMGYTRLCAHAHSLREDGL